MTWFVKSRVIFKGGFISHKMSSRANFLEDLRYYTIASRTYEARKMRNIPENHHPLPSCALDLSRQSYTNKDRLQHRSLLCYALTIYAVLHGIATDKTHRLIVLLIQHLGLHSIFYWKNQKVHVSWPIILYAGEVACPSKNTLNSLDRLIQQVERKIFGVYEKSNYWLYSWSALNESNTVCCSETL